MREKNREKIAGPANKPPTGPLGFTFYSDKTMMQEKGIRSSSQALAREGARWGRKEGSRVGAGG